MVDLRFASLVLIVLLLNPPHAQAQDSFEQLSKEQIASGILNVEKVFAASKGVFILYFNHDLQTYQYNYSESTGSLDWKIDSINLVFEYNNNIFISFYENDTEILVDLSTGIVSMHTVVAKEAITYFVLEGDIHRLNSSYDDSNVLGKRLYNTTVSKIISDIYTQLPIDGSIIDSIDAGNYEGSEIGSTDSILLIGINKYEGFKFVFNEVLQQFDLAIHRLYYINNQYVVSKLLEESYSENYIYFDTDFSNHLEITFEYYNSSTTDLDVHMKSYILRQQSTDLLLEKKHEWINDQQIYFSESFDDLQIIAGSEFEKHVEIFPDQSISTSFDQYGYFIITNREEILFKFDTRESSSAIYYATETDSGWYILLHELDPINILSWVSIGTEIQKNEYLLIFVIGIPTTIIIITIIFMKNKTRGIKH